MTPRPQNVRIAVSGDEDRLMKIFRISHEDNAIAPMSEEKVMKTIKHALNREGSFIGIIDGAKEIEGVICATLAQMWYSDAWHYDELVNFVHPDYRKSNHAKNLMDFAKWMTEQTNVPLHIGILTAKRLDAKVRLYQRQFKMGGAVFYHNANYGSFLEAAE